MTSVLSPERFVSITEIKPDSGTTNLHASIIVIVTKIVILVTDQHE